jgi:flagellin
MVVQHNIPAMNANRLYGINNSGLSKSLEKLSSGYAINRAGDNAAGLAVSEKMRAQISGLTQASKNAEDGISMVQTFEGALQETDSILQRMRTLAVQSANGTYQDDVDREAIQLEYDQLNDELNQIADTDFNGVIVLNGGEMADGTKADATGKIDYSTATRQAQQVGTAGGFVNGIAVDGYQATNEETVTFTATKNDDGTVTWAASENALSTVTNGADKTGGFSYDGAVISVDTTKIVSGDTITVNFTKPQRAVGQTSDTVGTNTDMGTIATDGTITNPSLAIDVTDNQITSDRIADATNYLNKLTVKTSISNAGAVAGTTVNDVDFTAGGTLMAYKDGGKITLGADDGIISYVDKNGAVTKLGTLTAAKITGATATTAGTMTTEFLTTSASYTPAKSSGVELVEPESKVSQADSNDASTATLNYTNNVTLQVGARTKDSVNFTFSYESNGIGELKADLDCSARGLGTDQLSLATQKDANGAIDKIDNAINKVSMVRASFGAMQNRLEHKIANLDTNNENLTAAESRIRDTDMAEEMTNFTKNQILAQASQAMLAQANQLPQGVLQLLG